MNKIILIALMATLALADIGKIAVVKGDATVERDVKILKARNDMGLFKQDVVETALGRMQMHFNDDTVISLGRDSRFVIKEYLYIENSDNVAATFKIEKGFVKTITGAIGKIMPDLFVMETSSTKITPHGTIWSVEVTDESEIYKVLEGRVTLAFNDGLDRKVELLAGETVRLEKLSGSRNIKSFKKQKMSKRVEESVIYESRIELTNSKIKEDLKITRITDTVAELPLMEEVASIAEPMSEPVDEPMNEPVDEPMDEPVDDDGNNGHGNDEDGVDDSNPGQGNKK